MYDLAVSLFINLYLLFGLLTFAVRHFVITLFKLKTITFRPAVELIALAKKFFLYVFQSNSCSVQTSQVEFFFFYLGETSLCYHSLGISNTVIFPVSFLFPIYHNFLPIQCTRIFILGESRRNRTVQVLLYSVEFRPNLVA